MLRGVLDRIRRGPSIASAEPAAPVSPLAPILDIEGFCPICEAQTRFTAFDPWLRDHLLCVHCQSVPRERALVTTLNRYYPHWRSLRIHESSPSLRGSAKLQRECPGYVGSHYEPSIPFGTVHPAHGLRSENLERQTFADASFDLVITQDVFEHLFRPDLAVAEIARTLTADGAHVFTVPISRFSLPSIRRARRTETGEAEHLMEPIYHGNPIDESGSLVTIDYGYDIAPYLDRHSGLTTTIVHTDDLSLGIRAEFIEVLVSRKFDGPPTIADGPG